VLLISFHSGQRGRIRFRDLYYIFSSWPAPPSDGWGVTRGGVTRGGVTRGGVTRSGGLHPPPKIAFEQITGGVQG
jgi:hypothetical protein